MRRTMKLYHHLVFLLSTELRLIFGDMTTEYVTLSDGAAYRIYLTAKSWHSAQVTCQQDGAHLAVIENDEGWEAWKKTKCTGPYWVGGVDANSKNDWKWVTGNPVEKKYWKSGEPNNFMGVQEDCMLSCYHGDNGYMYDAPCSSRLTFVCMKSNSPDSKSASKHITVNKDGSIASIIFPIVLVKFMIIGCIFVVWKTKQKIRTDRRARTILPPAETHTGIYPDEIPPPYYTSESTQHDINPTEEAPSQDVPYAPYASGQPGLYLQFTQTTYVGQTNTLTTPYT